jgi:hypothetical protein
MLEGDGKMKADQWFELQKFCEEIQVLLKLVLDTI